MKLKTRPSWTNARAQQTVLRLVTSNHNVYCERAIAFVTSVLLKNRFNHVTLLNLLDTIINLERDMFKKSLVLNGLVNFCIAHGDGVTMQHQLLNRVLGTLLEKYYK
ncbi:hypothetical protein [Epiphyas postvittana nucleopolyhedrovirus]|uniref:Ac19-like protein n=1 Tax=Epiphyas postvittana nucleopolyhedrovirus TaxID=70600 RepID=Q91GN3_NPVEP|nr:hypothetical protein [Epiphyas postvittana nucleopolyhedrovirus]AAK85580.1 unknown [Epiphyas postvittana nucleopolyhedrovirus]